MRARLKAKVHRWKTTAMATTKKYALCQARLRRAHRRIVHLEAENKALKEARRPTKVFGHSFPVERIALAVFIVVHGNGSLRCAAKTVGFVARLLGWPYPAPSHSSVRRWILRLGLAQLEQTVNRTGEYIGLLDESIQIGGEKLLLLLGLRIDHDQHRGRPLEMKDVCVLGMEVQSSWTGVQVAQFLLRFLRRAPGIKLRYCITDGGTNLNKALRLCGIAAVGDCTHIMMNAVKKTLSGHVGLQTLARQMGQFRRQALLSTIGYLAPPTLRDKDRFLRLFTILPWLERIERHWPTLSEQVRLRLAFINDVKPHRASMTQLKKLVELSANILKSAGLSEASRRTWEKAVAGFAAKYALSEEAQSFIEQLRAYFDKHEGLVERYSRLVCCTDIEESTFGRYKNKGGMAAISADVLSIALYEVNFLKLDEVQKSLLAVPYQTVQRWETQYVCENRYGLIRRLDRELKSDAA